MQIFATNQPSKNRIQTLPLTDERGQAMAELVLIAITLLFTILGVIQMALILNAYSLVRYAAYNATRAGIVHNANLDVMKEAARISLLATFPSHGRADHVLGLMENYRGAKETDDDPALTNLGEPITKVDIIHPENIPCGEVVTFDDPVDADKGLLTVKVTHHYEMVIPLVGRMLYFVYQQVRSGAGYSGASMNEVAGITDQMRRTGDYRDIEYRIPLVSSYTMRMQSDFIPPGCS